MSDIERIGISIEKKLLSGFDKLITRQGYKNRSEAVRDLIRDQLSQQALANPQTNAIAAITIVYNHHSKHVPNKLASLQHQRFLKSICSTHIHIDKHNCMEIIVLRGKVKEITKIAEQITSTKGVTLSKVNLIDTEKSTI